MCAGYKATSATILPDGGYQVSFQPTSGPKVRGIGTAIFFHTRNAQRYSRNTHLDINVQGDSLCFKPCPPSKDIAALRASVIALLEQIGINTSAIATSASANLKHAKAVAPKQLLTA